MAQHKIFCILALFVGLFIHTASSQSTTAAIPFPQSIINEMSTRYMRYHHYLWHQVRENWNKYPAATKEAFKNIGWEPPRAARSFDANGVSSAILDNNSGEDFLYMHRNMIKNFNSIIAANKEKYGNVKGWTTIPAPGNTEFPVPPAYTIPSSASTTSSTTTRKTDSFYTNTILKNEKLFNNYTELRKMSLGELGARIEVTVHGYLHMRFSEASPLGYRTSYKGTIPYIDKQWDNPSYNWLGDSYGSHVHPIFWKIHGWVDDRIEDWRKANNLTTIKWKGTWTGGPMSNLTSVLKKESSLRGAGSENDGEMDMSVMEEALQLVLNSGVPEACFADEVKVAPWPGLEDEDEGVVEPTPPKKCNKKKSVL